MRIIGNLWTGGFSNGYSAVFKNIQQAEKQTKLFVGKVNMFLNWHHSSETPSSGILHRVALVRTEVSEESSDSIIRVTRIAELGTTLAVISNRRRFLQEPQDVIFQKTAFFLSNIYPNYYLQISHAGILCGLAL
jgi:hypothetical protein